MTADVGVQDKFATVNGLRLHYREWGVATAPPLVLLHGVMGTARVWDRFAATMADHFHIFALDQRGHGESEWAGAYSTELMAQDLRAFADQFGFGRFALVGHSMGGRNAFLYAAERPETLDRLVIVDIGPNVPPGTPDQPSTTDRLKAATQATFADPEEAVEFMRQQNPRPSDEDRRNMVLNNLVRREDASGVHWFWHYDAIKLAARRPEDRAPADELQWQLFKKITCPTLLVRGAQSPTLGRETAEQMERTFPNCRLVEVPNAGHGIMGDNPAGFLAVVRPFLLGEA